MNYAEVFREIRQLREEFNDRLDARVASLVRMSQVALSTASGDGDAVQGNETTSEEVQGGYQYEVRRLWPFGIRSRPPANVDAVVVHAFGGPTNGIMVGAESPEYGPSDLAEGETAIYCKAANAVIKFDKDGNITVTAAPDKSVTVQASGTGAVNVSATTATGAVNLGPLPVAQVLVFGSLDSLGVPVQQNPAAVSGGGPGTSLVKSG